MATSVAAATAAAATIAFQQATGSIHNDDASPSSPAAAVSSKVNPGEIVKVGGDEEELRLLAWGSNRFALTLSALISRLASLSCCCSRECGLFPYTLSRSRIISPDASDAIQIRTPAVASFLQDVALRDLAVHATHAVCVDGRGDVYQWGDGFFGQRSASDSREPMLTLQGKVRLSHSPRVGGLFLIAVRAEHHSGTGHGIPCLCTLSFWKGIRDICPGTPAKTKCRPTDTLQHTVVGHRLVVG